MMRDFRTMLRPRGQAGQALMTFALSATALMMFAGLTFDVGALYLEKRRVQVAADAAAFGAAHEIVRKNWDYVTSAAHDDAILNGYDDASSAVRVTVNHPPLSGSKIGDDNYVEVIIERDVPTTFMRVAGPEFSTVHGRAVAGSQPDFGPRCLLALNGSASESMRFVGTSDLIAPNCDMQTNSNAPDAIYSNGGACVLAKEIGYPADGGVRDGSECLEPTPISNAIPAPDPYAYLEEPDLGSLPLRTSSRVILNNTLGQLSSIDGVTVSTDGLGNDVVTLLPGYYKGGLTLNGADVVMSPGLYAFDGFSVMSDTVLNGTGVTIYNSGNGMRNIYISGTSSVNLSAPLVDPYKNILFFNSRSAPNSNIYNAHIAGTSDSRYEGVFYFPTTELRYSGNANQTDAWTMIVADTVELGGTPNLSVTGWAASGRTPNTYRAALVE